MECIDVRFDEELQDKTKSMGCINPPDHHHYDNQDSEDKDETSKDTEMHSKGPSRRTQKNHPENQIIGDKSKEIQTRKKLVEKYEQVHIVMLSQIEPKKNYGEVKTNVG